MKIRLFVILTAALLAIPLSLPAQEVPATTQPSTAPAGAVIDVKETQKLKESIGQTVTVRGKVIEVFVSRNSGITIFNFFAGPARRDFNVVIDKANLDAVNAGFGGDVGAAVKDQTITVTGVVAEYRGNPQIKLDKPEQLKIEPAAAEAKPKQ
jgi:RecJ-like exonuclease